MIVPVLAVEKHGVRRHRLIRRRAKALAFEAVDTRLIVLLDLAEALLDRFVRHVVEADAGAARIVEQRFELRMKERQPVLLALIAPAAAYRFIERIIPRRAAEQFDVARAEQRRRAVSERHFRDRHQREFLHRFGGTLCLRVERLDALKLVAEKSSRIGLMRPGGKRSRMPPRTAKSPGSMTVLARWKP